MEWYGRWFEEFACSFAAAFIVLWLSLIFRCDICRHLWHYRRELSPHWIGIASSCPLCCLIARFGTIRPPCSHFTAFRTWLDGLGCLVLESLSFVRSLFQKGEMMTHCCASMSKGWLPKFKSHHCCKLGKPATLLAGQCYIIFALWYQFHADC